MTAGMLILLVFSDSLWWTAGVVVVIYGIAMEINVQYMTAFLPEICIEKQERSKVSAKCIVYGNASQVLAAILIAGASLALEHGSVSLKNGDFELNTGV